MAAMTTKDPELIEMTEFGPLVETADGSFTVRHATHGQDFHSREGAKFEAWELYVQASGYFRELQDPGPEILILDVGMGLSYNASATIAAWYESGGLRSVTMLSLEIDEKLVSAAVGGLAPWCRGWGDSWKAGLRELCQKDASSYDASLRHPKTSEKFSWKIIVGDAGRQGLPDLPAKLDFVWQDPFTPELNPLMWSPEWFAKVRAQSKRSTCLMTYSVSRVVKDALQMSDWSHERMRTPGRKRHWLRAQPVFDAPVLESLQMSE